MISSTMEEVINENMDHPEEYDIIIGRTIGIASLLESSKSDHHNGNNNDDDHDDTPRKY